MGGIQLKGVSKHFDGHEVLKAIDLEVREGEFLVILGASGGGKTTLLNLIAGLVPPSSGQILFDGKDVTETDVSRRNIAYVFQDYALYPHLTVRRNLRFPLENMKLKKRQADRKVRDVLKLLQLQGIQEKYPAQLSGGQKQRVALGRALVRDPFVFLFDEPLSSLDQQLRDHLRIELKQLHRRLGRTFIYVTHDQLSAMILGDRIAFLADQKIRQVAPPGELYHRPRNLQVARFLGFPPINLLPPGEFQKLSALTPPESTKTVTIRPEHVLVQADAEGRFQVDWIQKVGYATYAYFKAGSVSVCARCEDAALSPERRVRCRIQEPEVLFFDADGNRIERT